MGRKKAVPKVVDAGTAEHRARQIHTRIRVALWSVEPGVGPLKQEARRALRLTDPAARLEALRLLADRIRPHLSPAAQRWTLPLSLTRDGV